MSRKRRILIAAIAILMVSFICWRLSYSALERQLVGQWVTDGNTTWHFESNGEFFSITDGVTPDSRRWSVMDRQIILRNVRQSPFDNLVRWLQVTLNHYLGWPSQRPMGVKVHNITSFDGNTIILESGKTFRRVAE